MTKRILIVDDDPPTRLFVRTVLLADKTPLDIVEAATGAQCLQALESSPPPDLILLDVLLPDADGFELCKAMRKHGIKCPIVFLTSKTALGDYTAGREAGGDSYLTKPLNRAALRSLVNLFTNLEKKKEAR